MVVVELILTIVMYVVQIIRNEEFHYLSAPEEVLSLIKVDRIMKFGHTLPSVVLTILIATRVLPILSDSYAEQLALNEPIVPFTAVCLLLPTLILNGFIIESLLGKTNKQYEKLKKRTSSRT